MAQGLQLLLWLGILTQLLLGLRLAGKAADLWAESFEADYRLAVCGRYLALAANMRSAVATWRKLDCAEGEAGTVEWDIEDYLLDWKDHYGDWDPEHCEDVGPLQVSLHREENPDLDVDYPNWVPRYE